ncbi:MAG TPA: hypothetical protein VGJ91_12360 [Polyangiaceae bacterium]|jgi:hypothetical protein
MLYAEIAQLNPEIECPLDLRVKARELVLEPLRLRRRNPLAQLVECGA